MSVRRWPRRPPLAGVAAVGVAGEHAVEPVALEEQHAALLRVYRPRARRRGVADALVEHDGRAAVGRARARRAEVAHARHRRVLGRAAPRPPPRPASSVSKWSWWPLCRPSGRV